MKRTLLVLALAVCAAAGCRAIGPRNHCGCSEPCGCNEPCGMDSGYPGPQPDGFSDEGCCDPETGGNLYDAANTGAACQACGAAAGQCGCFDRYCGHECGPGYPDGQYDCSACGSCRWGCPGYWHLEGNPNQCYADCPPCGPQHPHAVKQAGYCCTCGQPGPGCHCGACYPSGDQVYDFNPGPPVGQTAYPYYTTRGPRDFLLANPPPIGPY